MAIYQPKSYINIRMLLRVIGWLLTIEAVFMLIPCVTGLVAGEKSVAGFLICMGVTAACGMALMSLRPKSREMGKREAILLTGFTWIILSIFGMLPFLVCGTHLTVTDAFFETMSGFTTTGTSVLTTLVDVPKSILIWRCTLQWIGGLGIILFTLAVIPMLNYQGGMQLFNAEVTGITHDKLRPRVSFTAQGLWTVYIVLTAALVILLNFSDMSFFDSLCYGLSTMSTGGFATSDGGVVQTDSIYVKIVLMVFMFIGGVNFSLIFKASKGDFRSALKNDVLKWYVIAILVFFLLLSINILLRGLGDGLASYTIDPLFQAVSILTSTGISQAGFHDWGPVATVVLIGMMFMGACAGSTSGGAKIDRVLVMFKFIKNEFYKMMHPNTVTAVAVNGKGMPQGVVMKTLAFLFLYVLVIIGGGCVLMMTGVQVPHSFFLALSAISNTGLGTDIVGLDGNFLTLPDLAKWCLALVMLIGRLEIYTILLLFVPSFWRK